MTSFYEADGLGSITSLTNSTGALTDAYTYDSFGNLTGSSGTTTNPYRYTGREFDSETGLYYYRSRYYDPTIGRFLSEDPMGFAGDDENFYAYVANSPVDWVDPFGLQAATLHPAPRPAPRGSIADDWTYGEIGKFGIKSLSPEDFSSPDGLADAKASIGAACTRNVAQGGSCNARRGTPQARGDIAAWNNIVNANGGTDGSAGGNLMCVNGQNCKAVHLCNRCVDGKKRYRERDKRLTPVGQTSVGEAPNTVTLYFYNDQYGGWDTPEHQKYGCRTRPAPRPRPRKRR